MMSIVVSTGTLVKRLSTSSDARMPFLFVVLRMFKNSSVDYIICLAGMYFFSMSFSTFEMSYTGVPI